MISISVTSLCIAQKGEDEPYVKTTFCIILSTKSYAEAKTFAETASKQTSIKLDLRSLSPIKKEGLTMPKKDCEENGFEYPSYVARGRSDNGEYISIEYSNAYTEFAKGYYIVVASSGDKKKCNSTLLKVKKIYKTAYLKESLVYVGCMH